MVLLRQPRDSRGSGASQAVFAESVVYTAWQTIMNENVTLIFNGFLQLPNLEKLALVEAINEYFDSNDRETIRAEADKRFAELKTDGPDFRCKCCGR